MQKESPSYKPFRRRFLHVPVGFRHVLEQPQPAIPPQSLLDRAREHGVATGAQVGNKEHALKQAKAGVDVLIASGGEAGGHCGEIATIVLIPEVLAAVKDYDVGVLAAGGIVKGRQMAACMAMGAQGAWTGSMWLTTKEAAVSEVIKEKFLAASSGETVRSKYRTGKFSRQLRSPWTDCWESDEAPANPHVPTLPPHTSVGVMSRYVESQAKMVLGGRMGEVLEAFKTRLAPNTYATCRIAD